MDNTQINIKTNGTTTLATAGKYCDRNIDVSVSVPVSGITPSGIKTITTNGTHDVAEYANVVVAVSTAQPTQFTNLYDPTNVVLKTRSDCSSGTVSFTSDNYVNYVVIPFHHKANEPIAIRMRGISCPVRDRQNITFFGADGTTVVSWGQMSSIIDVSYDEYGDMVCTLKSNGSPVTKEWYYMYLNFQYIGINGSASAAYTGPIITINELIGNGGYVG